MGNKHVFRLYHDFAAYCGEFVKETDQKLFYRSWSGRIGNSYKEALVVVETDDVEASKAAYADASKQEEPRVKAAREALAQALRVQAKNARAALTIVSGSEPRS